MLICAFVSLGLTFFLYYFKENTLSGIWKLSLSFFRFVVLFVLCALLLKPILKYASISFDKPIIILGIDNSKSMILSKDSAQNRRDINKKIEELMSSLSPDFEWKTLLIGEKVSSNKELDFSESSTNLSSFINHINNYYTYDNVTATVLISDGIFNKGANPSYQKWKIEAPLFTVGVGDSSELNDQYLVGVRSNSIAFLGNKFPIKIDVAVDGYQNRMSQLKVFGYGKELFSSEIEINSANYYSNFSFNIEAEKEGIQKFVVKIVPMEGEANTNNNKQVVYVNIKDKRQKVLLVYDFAHPDIAAIRKSIEKEDSYEVSVLKSDEFIKLKKENIEENYNMLIGFQIPMNTPSSIKAFNLIQSCSAPQWNITSNQTNHLTLFNADKGIQWSGQANKTNTVQGKLNPNFSLFTVTENKDLVNSFPPVKVPFGVLKYSAGSQVLGFQSIGGIQTEYPLWLFTSNTQGKRSAYFFGEGIWRWKMSEYEQNGNNKLFDELVTKTVQYLASKKDISRFRVFSNTSYYENDPIVWNAEFYNLSYELVNEPPVYIKVTNENDKVYELEMDREGDKYFLDMGKLSPGKYTYLASVTDKGKEFKKSGEFSVKKLDVEYKNLRADFNLMKTLAVKNGGQFFSLAQWDDLIVELSQQKATKRSYEEVEIKDLIHQKWLFALILLFIGVEWLVRKREGSI